MLRHFFMMALLSTLAGCELSDPAGDATALSITSAASNRRFEVGGDALDSYKLVGLESFTVKLRVEVPVGRTITAFGIHTAYETSLHPISPLPMPIPDGTVWLKQVALTEAPSVGDYPFELWLVNDRGQESNRLNGHIYIQ